MNSQLLITNKNSKKTLAKSKKLLDVTNRIVIKQTQKKEKRKIWQDSDTSLVWQLEMNSEKYDWNEIFDYVKKLNKEDYGGYNDWRIPTKKELETILSNKSYKNENRYKYFIKEPLINSLKGYYYWSSTVNKKNLNDAWIVSFGSGYMYSNNKLGKLGVKCVRG
jgi:hypothetical protein